MKILVIGSAIAALFLISPAMASRYARPLTPAELAPFQRAAVLVVAGEAACRLGNYAEAEKDYRDAKAATEWNLSADRGLAEVFAAEGRYEEAVRAYRVLLTPDPHIASAVTQEVRTHMGFAIALSQAGQWQEAVSVYEKVLPDTINWGNAPKIDVHFDPQVPMPAQLQALAHVAIGADYFGNGERENAFAEFGKAIRSDPNSPFANYYYGWGWGSLDPKDKVRIMDAQQAKAALQKAVKVGNATVKKAAEKALKDMG